jgi:hypothetical protein
MVQPRLIYSITVDDLKSHRWCYFHDDEEGYDAFEHVIPDTHPKFNERIMELELAEFTFRGGEIRYGSFDGSKCFSVFLNGDWFSLWSGVAEPSPERIAGFRMALLAQSLELPVRAVARWSKSTTEYSGLRYYNSASEECEIRV